MVNIDKEIINENINDAYNNQTEKVKKLLESAKKNLADPKECSHDYTASKEKVRQLCKVNRVITKKKQDENQTEERINTKFSEMNEKLDINSKNLDFIFKNVSDTNKSEMDILNSISQKQKQDEEMLNKTMQQVEEQANKTEKYTIEIKDSIENHIKEAKVQTINSVSEGQSKLQEILLNANSSIEYNILDGQKESEKRILYSQNAIESKMEQLQQINEEKLIEMKNEIIKTYQKENKHAISSLLEERNGYLKELQEKDREIRQLNYKIYEYEEKLEKEIARREKFSIFAPFFRKQEVEEEQPIFTSQILSYVYQK